ncbi:hypothetical protein J6590_073189 [Homalodisca vitripennis]|nr:hypothetical protein J6590_073189 [Homalodisca vitripennis]
MGMYLVAVTVDAPLIHDVMFPTIAVGEGQSPSSFIALLSSSQIAHLILTAAELFRRHKKEADISP